MMKDFMNKEEVNAEEMVKDLGVFELRGLARQLGVASPTTKKRDELIALISEAIKVGKTEVNVARRGRPYKKLNILDSITNKINPDYNRPVKIEYNSIISFAQEETKFDSNVAEESLIFEGIARKQAATIGVYDLRTRDFVVLAESCKNYEKIVTGDRVKLNGQKVFGEGHYVSFQILEINGVAADDYKPADIEEGEDIIDDRTIPFDKGEVKVGRRNLYKLDDDLYENDSFRNFYKQCKERGYEFITMGVNMPYENQIMLKGVGIENNFTTTYGASADENFSIAIDAINYACNLREKGGNVVVFVTDIVGLMRGLDANFVNDSKEGKENEEHSLKTIVIIQKLLAFAKSSSNHSSGTLVMCYEEGDSNDKFLTNDIFKISKKVKA